MDGDKRDERDEAAQRPEADDAAVEDLPLTDEETTEVRGGLAAVDEDKIP